METFRTDNTEEQDTTCALTDVARLDCAVTHQTLTTIPISIRNITQLGLKEEKDGWKGRAGEGRGGQGRAGEGRGGEGRGGEGRRRDSFMREGHVQKERNRK